MKKPIFNNETFFLDSYLFELLFKVYENLEHDKLFKPIFLEISFFF